MIPQKRWESTQYTVDQLQEAMDAGGWDFIPPTEVVGSGTQFQKSFKQYIYYTGPDANGNPIMEYVNPNILTQPGPEHAPIMRLKDDVTSWEEGDQIVVGSTNFDARESEVFTLVKCDECASNEVKLDRTPTNTHWGRIDTQTGVDQRAEVGLLSRNVRFYGKFYSQIKSGAVYRLY